MKGTFVPAIPMNIVHRSGKGALPGELDINSIQMLILPVMLLRAPELPCGLFLATTAPSVTDMSCWANLVLIMQLQQDVELQRQKRGESIIMTSLGLFWETSRNLRMRVCPEMTPRNRLLSFHAYGGRG